MRSSSGMTLVELLAALTLSAMLMAVLLGLVSHQLRTNNRLVETHPFEPSLEIFVRQFEDDYRACHHVDMSPTRFVMRGFSDSFSRAEFSATALPTLVRYTIDSDSGNLFRSQKNFGSTSEETSSRLSLTGVSRFVPQTELETDAAPGVFLIDVLLLDQNIIPLNLTRY